jgi:hypothetical protein
MQPSVLADERWSHYVRSRHGTVLFAQNDPLNAWERLDHLKRCMWEAHDVIQDLRRTDAVHHAQLTCDDKAAVVMRCIRAREKGKWRQARLLHAAVPHMDTLAPHAEGIQSAHGLQRLRDWVIALAKEALLHDLRRLQGLSPDEDRQSLQNLVARRIARLRRNTPTGLQATRDDRGEIHTDSEHMTVDLHEHWSQIFGGPVRAHPTATARWIRRIAERTRTRPREPVEAWHIRDEHIRGPFGIATTVPRGRMECHIGLGGS